ncbi:hypothetical protein I4F81_000116 [Pyropia yezoensis]|uniref:Uncharacterized protein n=1 Tax=Pyropia yezoensis TaxID=2788 RepID=A0ACC3BI89_PYRYE|nr:hypothetical protein I4F81_000116 [Neopyropia yezoensis]
MGAAAACPRLARLRRACRERWRRSPRRTPSSAPFSPPIWPPPPRRGRRADVAAASPSPTGEPTLGRAGPPRPGGSPDVHYQSTFARSHAAAALPPTPPSAHLPGGRGDARVRGRGGRGGTAATGLLRPPPPPPNLSPKPEPRPLAAVAAAVLSLRGGGGGGGGGGGRGIGRGGRHRGGCRSGARGSGDAGR